MIRARTLTVPAIAVALAAVIALAVSGCCVNPNAVATVNGQAILRSAVDKQLEQIKKASPQTFSGKEGKRRETEFRGRILESLIQSELIRQGAAAEGVSVTDEKVDEYVNRIASQYGGAQGFASALKDAGTNLEDFREQALGRLTVEAITAKLAKERSFTAKEVKAYYDQNPKLFSTGDQVKVRQILVANRSRTLATDLFGKVKSGGDFAALAKKHSLDLTSKGKGGELGWMPANGFEPEMIRELRSAKVGGYGMAQTTSGWHVFQLQARKSATVRPLKEVEGQIRAILQQQADSSAFTKFLDAQRSKATIVVLDPELQDLVRGSSGGQAKK